MRFDAPSACLTRLIIDDDRELELAELQTVKERIEGAVRYVVPPSHRSYVGDALLHLAVERTLQDGAVPCTSSPAF